jgi:hypothetical protein
MASRVTGLFAILFALAGCRADGTAPGGAPIQRTFDFSRGVAGWTIGQADYAPATAPTDVIGEARPLPAPLTGSGLLLSGTNSSDDLFLYATTRMPDLAPGATYRVAATVAFATDVPTGCAGVGGSPGESVWLIVGAATGEPRTVFDGREYRVNLQRGNQSAGGPQGGPLGTIGNTVPNCGPRRWETKQLASPDAVPGTVTADPQGTAWLLVGMDSGFESLSRIYLQRVTVTLTPTAR